MTLLATLLRRSKYFVAIPMLTVAGAIGWYVDHEDNLSLTRFRGKSKLYGRDYAPGEKPPWP